jgi:outer membrane lipoprotein-sorting protein
MFTKWVPSVTVAGVIAAGAIALPMQASAVDLPERSVAELLAAMDESVEGFSGSVTKTSNMGLPELEMSQMMSEEMVADMEERMPEGFEDFVPQLVEQNPLTDAISFLAGTDTIRVYASEEGFRAQILDPMSQRDVIVNKDAFYSYNAKTNTVLTRSIDGDFDKPTLDELNSEVELDLTNPDELASALLEEAEGKATITVGADHRVAGQDAYRLVVTPESSVSLVERIDISVDANTGLGLGVQVYSTEQSDVAFSVAFDTISYDTPEASIFAFSPPPGATVETLEFPAEVESTLTELQREDLSDAEKEALLESLKADMEAEFAPGVTTDTLGEGFDTVLTMNQLPEAFPLEMLENEILADFSTEVDGGTVFSTPLSNTLLTDSGEVYTGAVSVEYLLELASN